MSAPSQEVYVRIEGNQGIKESVAALTKDLSQDENARKKLLATLCQATSSVESSIEVMSLMIMEVSYETYSFAPVSTFLSNPSAGGGFKFMFDEGAKSAVHIPEFLAKTGFKNPGGPSGCFQSAFKTDLQLFPWLMQHPEQMRYFNDLMDGSRLMRVEWFDVVPAEEVLFDSQLDTESPLIVDIGGNRGNDLKALKTRYPDAKGQFVLQDLPPVIGDIKNLHEDIVRMPYDFFTPQPIIGKFSNTLLMIPLTCREILGNVVKAMKSGYSKLLIFEFVLPDVGTPLLPALLDIQMLAVLSGTERTETMWRKLLEEVGLEVVRFWKKSEETEGLIEAVVKA